MNPMISAIKNIFDITISNVCAALFVHQKREPTGGDLLECPCQKE